MKLYTIDFETAYDKDYSLSKLQTDEYILHPRFEVIGVGIKEGDDPAYWATDADMPGAVSIALSRIDWENAAVVCHHAHFDGFIISQIYGHKPKVWLDTLSMARMLFPWLKSFSLSALATEAGVGAKGTAVKNFMGYWLRDFNPTELSEYAEYCRNDVELTYALARAYMPRVPNTEFALIDMTIRMFTEPHFVGDVLTMQAQYEQELARKALLLDDASVGRDIIMSNEKFASVLWGLGVAPPTKPSPRTGKMTYAFAKTDEAFLALLEHPLPQVQALVAARLGVKTTIAETRALRMKNTAERTAILSEYVGAPRGSGAALGALNQHSGALPVYLNFWGAKVTGRYSGGNMINWQNLPARGPSAGLRDAIVAPPGYVVVVGDSSNIELRVAMACAGQTDVLDKIASGVDLYCDFASKLFGRTITKADKKERQIGKIAMLSLQYGAGWVKFKEMVRAQAGEALSDDSARMIVDLYRTVHGHIPALWDYCDSIILPDIHNTGGSMVPVDKNSWCITGSDGFGVLGAPGVVYHNLRKNADNEWVYTMGRTEATKLYGGKVVENLCVDGAALVLTHVGWKPLSTITDELVFDGVDFVKHGGKVLKGTKQCVSVDGVYMTPDHEVLTDEGWKTALEKPKPYRPSVWGANRTASIAQRWEENALGVQVPVWFADNQGRRGRYQRGKAWWYSQLWMLNREVASGKEWYASNVKAPCVRYMAKYVRPMQTAYTSGMEKLRRAWNYGLRAVGCFVHELLERHGSGVCHWAYARPHRQLQGVRYAELPMDYLQTTSTKQTQQHRSGFEGAVRANRHTPFDAVLPLPTREVFDLMDCGPRNRFVVLGNDGALVVHNCQHVARQIVMWQTARIHKRFPVALSVHDEAACVVPLEQKADCLDYMSECLSMAPPWCAGEIPLACEVGAGASYGSAK